MKPLLVPCAAGIAAGLGASTVASSVLRATLPEFQGVPLDLMLLVGLFAAFTAMAAGLVTLLFAPTTSLAVRLASD